jgi:hypothetical protein
LLLSFEKVNGDAFPPVVDIEDAAFSDLQHHGSADFHRQALFRLLAGQ